MGREENKEAREPAQSRDPVVGCGGPDPDVELLECEFTKTEARSLGTSIFFFLNLSLLQMARFLATRRLV